MMKKRGSKAKKRILGFLALALVAVIGIGSGLAYLTDFDAATNKFTLGDTDIDLDEPNWKNPVKAVTEINGDDNGTGDRNGDDVVVGDVLTYSVTAYNGDIESHDIVITDTIDAGLDVIESSISHEGTYNGTDRVITWTITDVAQLSEVTVFFKATVNESAETKVDNDAWAKVGENDAKQTNKVSNPLTTEEQEPKKEVNQFSESGINGAVVTVGDEITYDITFYNNTDNAGTVTVTDPLDEQVSFVSASDGGTESDGTVTWTFSDMPAHSSKTIQLTVKVETVMVSNELDPITNQATSTDPENSYDTNIVTNPVTPPETPKKPEKTYDESTVAGANGAKVNVKDVITYKISYYNHETEAVNVVITDTIDVGLTVDEASISNGGTYDPQSRMITWTITGAPALTNGFVTFKAAVNEDAVVRVVNEAYVKIGENNEVKTNKLVNPTEDPSKPGDTEVKDPTVTGLKGDSFLRIKVSFTDKNGNLLTDVDQINKIIETLYYDTSYQQLGSVSDPSILTSNIVKGTAYSSTELADLVTAGKVMKEYNSNLFALDNTRTDVAGVRYYNYMANGGVFGEGDVATLFTNAVLPSDWTGEDFDVLGGEYMIKVMAQACQIENLTQEKAFELLDDQAPKKP